jgi:hypothetical protein
VEQQAATSLISRPATTRARPHLAPSGLIEIIHNGMPHRPGLPNDAPTMPAFGDRLTTAKMRAILAHAETWLTDERRQFQSK